MEQISSKSAKGKQLIILELPIVPIYFSGLNNLTESLPGVQVLKVISQGCMSIGSGNILG